MDDPARLRLAEERRLIFENYANGVDIEDLKAAFLRSAAEIEKEIFFVARKIKEYRVRRCAEGSPHAQFPVPCETLLDIRVGRFPLLETLKRLGPNYLSSELLLPKITIQKVSHPSEIREAAHRVNHS